MTLSTELIDAYLELLSNPQHNGLTFMPIKDCFIESETVTATHILYADYLKLIERSESSLPKVVAYIIFQKIYGPARYIDEHGFAGYKLKVIPFKGHGQIGDDSINLIPKA